MLVLSVSLLPTLQPQGSLQEELSRPGKMGQRVLEECKRPFLRQGLGEGVSEMQGSLGQISFIHSCQAEQFLESRDHAECRRTAMAKSRVAAMNHSGATSSPCGLYHVVQPLTPLTPLPECSKHNPLSSKRAREQHGPCLHEWSSY